MNRSDLLILDSVDKHHLTSKTQHHRALDYLIPRGYISARGTWKLTRKGRNVLRRETWDGARGRDSRRTPKKRASGGLHTVRQKKKPGTFYVTAYSHWNRGNTVEAVNFRTREAAEKWAHGKRLSGFKVWQVPHDHVYR